MRTLPATGVSFGPHSWDVGFREAQGSTGKNFLIRIVCLFTGCCLVGWTEARSLFIKTLAVIIENVDNAVSV